MMHEPRFMIGLGLVLMVVGMVLPFLMVSKLIESTFFLNFFAWGASISGLFLGMIGFGLYTRIKKDD